MITIPVYELLLLPGVTFFFKKDMFPKGRITEENIGEEISNTFINSSGIFFCVCFH